MSDDNVRDFSMRRKSQLQENDPVLQLAGRLARLLADCATEFSPCDQVVALDLAGRALCEALRHAQGEVGFNGTLLDAQQKMRSYTIKWPETDQSPTVYDGVAALTEEPKQAQVVRLVPTNVPVIPDDDPK